MEAPVPPPRGVPRWLGALGAFALLSLWGALVFKKYYLVHVVVLSVFRTPFENVATVLAALAVIVTAAALGEGMLRFLGPVEGLALRLLTATALGAGGLAIAVYVAGFFGVANILVVFALVVACHGVGLRRLVADLRDLVRAASASRMCAPTAFACATFAALGLTMLVSALAPPNDWDELSYHIPLAVEASVTGKFPLFAHNHSYLPELCESLTAVGLDLGGTYSVGRVLHFSFGVLLACSVFLAARDLAPEARWVRWMSVAILAVEPTVTDIARVADVDLTMAFFAVVGVLNLLRADPTWRAPLVAGILGGYACGTTYRGIHTAVALTACALVAGRIRTFWAFAAGGVVAGCPWYLRNLILSGNPIYPFFAKAFPERNPPVPTAFTELGWPDPQVRLRHFATGGYGTSLPLRDWLRLPWDATINGRRFTGGKFDTDISPFYLAVLPSIVFVRPRALPRPLVVWITFAFVHSVSWAFGLWCTRYEMPAFAAFAVLFPAVVASFRLAWARAATVAVAATSLVVLYVATMVKISYRTDTRVVFGTMDKWTYLEQHEDGLFFRHVERVNRYGPDRGPVLMFGDKRQLYVERPVIPDFNLDNVGALIRNGGGTPEGMRDLLHKSGIHDILEQTIESHRTMTEDEERIYDDFCARYTTIVSGNGTYMLWREVK